MSRKKIVLQRVKESKKQSPLLQRMKQQKLIKQEGKSLSSQ